MILNLLFYSSLFICITGICYKTILWTRNSLGYQKDPVRSSRLSLVLKDVITICSKKFPALVLSFFLDVLLQRRILKVSFLRWFMHSCIFAGFMGLVIMHAFDGVITENIFPYYYSTINPFFFLRNVFGFMVLLGISIAIFRRYISKQYKLRNSHQDIYAILIVFIIVFSGILLEGFKMTSVNEFTSMAEDYADLAYEEDDTLAIETYWVKEFALVSSRIKEPFDKGILEIGKEIHEESCADCHSSSKSAFMGYAAAKIIAPAAIFLDERGGVDLFYYVHIILCFIGLALLPFSKMFHIFATPVSLLSNWGKKKKPLFEHTGTTKYLMELDACTHCCTCNTNCSAGMMYEFTQNEFILPSEKMQALNKVSANSGMDSKEFDALFQGLYLCTNCDRCTIACPSGIDLKSLWLNARENLIGHNLSLQKQSDPLMLSVFSFVRGLKANDQKNGINKEAYDITLDKTLGNITKVMDNNSKLYPDPKPCPDKLDFTIDLIPIQTFSYCFGCQNCTTVCPVVGNYEVPEEHLTLMPHQIMYSLGLGFFDLAKSSLMIWNCLSCYQCQEHCPQNVAVCDIFFQLKNKAFNNIEVPCP